MSATTAGSLKAYIESLGLGISVYRDRPPNGKEVPYITVSESISTVPEIAFNVFDDSEGHVSELAQVDIWQRWRDNETGVVEESYTLADAVYKALNGARLSTAPSHVSGVLVQNMVRLFETETQIVHHSITINIHRVLQRIA